MVSYWSLKRPLQHNYWQVIITSKTDYSVILECHTDNVIFHVVHKKEMPFTWLVNIDADLKPRVALMSILFV